MGHLITNHCVAHREELALKDVLNVPLKVLGCKQFDQNDLSNSDASQNKRFYRFPDAKCQNSQHYTLFPTANKIFCEDDWIDNPSICANRPDIYPNLSQIAQILLTINCQNAVVERGFSVAHRIKTKARARINVRTLDALMHLQLNRGDIKTNANFKWLKTSNFTKEFQFYQNYGLFNKTAKLPPTGKFFCASRGTKALAMTRLKPSNPHSLKGTLLLPEK
uniref:HAT C-terminal dimerisation domain-containing protein n=1 Tax=Romanomermis culicivorax TaxID=13658 RepID=A0A915L8P4_ROMCU